MRHGFTNPLASALGKRFLSVTPLAVSVRNDLIDAADGILLENGNRVLTESGQPIVKE